MYLEDNFVSCFFILVSGKVEICKFRDGKKVTFAELSSGTIFGHLRIKEKGEVLRTDCAWLSQDSVLFTIFKDDYLTYINNFEDRHPKFDLVANLPFFKSKPESLDKMSKFIAVLDIKANTTFLEEDSETDKVFWVLEGALQISQKLVVKVTSKNGRQNYKPYRHGEPLEENEKTMVLSLGTKCVKEGFSFPNLTVMGEKKEKIQFLGHEYLDRAAFEDHYAKEPTQKMEYTVKTIEKTVLASISFSELLHSASNEVIYSLIFNLDAYPFKKEELEEQYFTERIWASNKNNILSELKKRK